MKWSTACGRKTGCFSAGDKHDPLLPAAPGSRDGGQLLHRVRLQAENCPAHLYAAVQSQLWGLQFLPLCLCWPVLGAPHGKGQQGIRFITPRLQKKSSVSRTAIASAFSLVAEKPVTESVGLSTKPTLKSPAVIPTPFIISVSLRNVWRKPTEVSFHCVLLCRLTVSAFSLPAES